MTNNKPRRARIEALDVLRGALILGMIADHILYDCVVYLDVPYRFFDNPIRLTLHYIGSFLFILLSGASSSVSRSNWKRGAQLGAIALGVTLATWIVDPGAFIIFGILHCLAVCTLLYALARPAIDRIPRSVQSLLWVVLFLVTFPLAEGYRIYTPGLWIFGFPDQTFFSADYFPLLPWIFAYLLGTWAGDIIFGQGLPAWFYSIRCDRLAWVGRHSLIIYLAHQPVILGIFLLVQDVLAHSGG